MEQSDLALSFSGSQRVQTLQSLGWKSPEVSAKTDTLLGAFQPDCGHGPIQGFSPPGQALGSLLPCLHLAIQGIPKPVAFERGSITSFKAVPPSFTSDQCNSTFLLHGTSRRSL